MIALLIVLLLLNLSSYWIYHKSGGNASILLLWLLFSLFISYAWVERTQALTWWQLIGHSLRGSLWLPFSGLLSFSFWRYSWQPPSLLLDYLINHRWQILPLLLLGYLGLVALTLQGAVVGRLKVIGGWLLLLVLLAVILLLLQWGCDQLGDPIKRNSARLFWLLWLNGKYLLWLGLLSHLRQQSLIVDYRWASVGLLVLVIFAWPLSGAFIAKGATHPQIIAHRGVDGGGVPNTLSALKLTTPAQPSLVEIDLRLTQDQQFVVSHDADTHHLARQNQIIAQTTLAQLQQLTLTENGRQGHYASFSDYLQTAKQAQQPLLIELKAGAHFRTLTTKFVQQYRAKLPATTQFHSTNLATVNSLRQQGLAPVGYILPFTLTGLPATAANFYSVDWRTLNPLIVVQAQQKGKPLYIWTVDHNWVLQAVRHLKVDAVITDQTSKVQRQMQQAPGYVGNLILLLLNF